MIKGNIGQSRNGTPCIEVLPEVAGGRIRGTFHDVRRVLSADSVRLSGPVVGALIESRGGPGGVSDADLSELLVHSDSGKFVVAKGVVACFDFEKRTNYIPGPLSGKIEEVPPKTA